MDSLDGLVRDDDDELSGFIGAAESLVAVFDVDGASSVAASAELVLFAWFGGGGRLMYSRWDVSSPFKFLRHTGHVPC